MELGKHLQDSFIKEAYKQGSDINILQWVFIFVVSFIIVVRKKDLKHVFIFQFW